MSGHLCEGLVEEGGIILPAFSAAMPPPPGVPLLYCALLLWVFVGVSALTERLMESIAVITSKGHWVDDGRDEDGLPQQLEVLTWNPTVANLTLMAIGSSAPEILLSSVELLGGGMYSGELGPMTIVGSAAFNLLLITGICMNALSGGETRKIHHYHVFCATAVRCTRPRAAVLCASSR